MVISPTPNPHNLEGQWFSVGVFLPLAHVVQLFGGAGYSPLATVTRLPKHSQGLRWQGRVTCDFSGRACSLTVGISRHLWGEHWWHLLTSPRPDAIALSPLSVTQTMNNRVFNNSIRVVKDVHFPWTNCCTFENDFQALVQLTTGTDRQSRVESKQIF